jgi:hypothetical protein
VSSEAKSGKTAQFIRWPSPRFPRFAILLAFAQFPHKSHTMKKLAWGLLLLSASATSLFAQISSTECLDEVKKVYAQMDHELLLAGAVQMHFGFKHSYIMRLDETGKTVVLDESKTLGPKFYLHDCSEFTEGSDDKEGFSFRKYQFLVYRTKPTLAKAALIPDVDKGIFATCFVKECGFIPVPNNDTLRYKRAYMTVNDDGQKRYKVRDMEFVWNPWNHAIVAITVNFTDKSMWKWAKFEFSSIIPEAIPLSTDVKSMLLDESGELRPRFKGSEILDYR